MSIFNSALLGLLNPNYHDFLYSCNDFYFQKSNHGLVSSTLLNSDASLFFFFPLSFSLQSISLKWVLLQVSPNELNLWRQNKYTTFSLPIWKSPLAYHFFFFSGKHQCFLADSQAALGGGEHREHSRTESPEGDLALFFRHSNLFPKHKESIDIHWICSWSLIKCLLDHYSIILKHCNSVARCNDTLY